MVRELRAEDIFQAIAHPTRRAILEILRGGDMPVAQLAEPLDISPSALSQHLGVLKSVGLLSEERRGRQRVYHLDPDPLREIHEWITGFDQYWTERLDALDNFLRTHHDEHRIRDDDKKPRE